MTTLGRVLQILGLTILPAAMVLELSNSLGQSFGLSEMLVMMVFGVCIFYLGRILEGYAHR